MAFSAHNQLFEKYLEMLGQCTTIDTTLDWEAMNNDVMDIFPLNCDMVNCQERNDSEILGFCDEPFATCSNNPMQTSRVHEAFFLQLETKIPQKKNGRRDLRHRIPNKMKTEDLDKFWLRSFRAYMLIHLSAVHTRMTSEDCAFWKRFLSQSEQPEKGASFSSYNRKYKDFLFSHLTFTTTFRTWFQERGEKELDKKRERCSAEWTALYDYCMNELLDYKPGEAFSKPKMMTTRATVPVKDADFMLSSHSQCCEK